MEGADEVVVDARAMVLERVQQLVQLVLAQAGALNPLVADGRRPWRRRCESEGYCEPWCYDHGFSSRNSVLTRTRALVPR
ncbi:MAG: hypothetical protein SGPRY_014184, partial [Prymnesium sp.]